MAPWVMAAALLSLPAQAAPADAGGEAATAAEAASPADDKEKAHEEEPSELEFVGGDEAPEAVFDDQPPPASTNALPTDETAPEIQDFAIAAQNPTAAPRVSAVVTDDLSGIETVRVRFKRTAHEDFEAMDLAPADGGLFLGVLPNGVQTEGFVYYVEVADAVGNVAVLGSADEPLAVAPAKESAYTRLERERAAVAPGPAVHPAWVALALGVGFLSAAGSAVAWVDFVRVQLMIQQSADPTLPQLALGDAAIGGVLGVIAAAGLLTGGGLLLYSALEE